MKMKKILVVLAMLFCFGSASEANEASVTVPVTLNLTGACEIQAPTYDMSYFSFFLQNSIISRHDITTRCSNNMPYTVTAEISNSSIPLTKGGKTFNMQLYADSGFTSLLSPTNKTIISSTGTGNTVTIPVHLKYLFNTGNACSHITGENFNFYSCEAGTYTGTVTYRVAW